MQILSFLLKKLTYLVILLFVVALITFLLVSLSPIDPIRAYIGADMLQVSPEQKEQIEIYWGLKESKPEQFISWITSLLKADFGTSLIYRAPVSEVIADKFFASLLLMGIAWILSLVGGIVLGSIAGMRQNGLLDRIIQLYSYVLVSTPGFWFGLLLLMIFAVGLGIFPIGLASPIGMLEGNVSFLDRLYHVILPALTLSILGTANIALHTREKLIEILKSPFILQAKAQGLKGFSLYKRHAFRHTILPAISLHFASFGELFGGAILAEQVFSYPGLGQAVVDAGLGGDVPLLLGIVIISAGFVFVGNFLADVLYKIIDPRFRKGLMKL
ncbi:ABC transporter permease [Saliterribacillus persicus]|uniref:Peptide/nickel transport system permease protein n=1 Tax=Saliterribacillus persicus TaxID=930114 RepID=A0A368Y7T0_9BACI|nr:ABC transporter permease [Saliterribacillus persicus]RCW74877.1 peptide/nickel transport system permease protein [Saliterribacillus persicus]